MYKTDFFNKFLTILYYDDVVYQSLPNRVISALIYEDWARFPLKI